MTVSIQTKTNKTAMDPATNTHPALLTESELDGMESDALIRSGVRSPYALDVKDIHIPSPTIKGRLPGGAITRPNSFTANINKATGVLRIDNLDHPEFWMEINLYVNILK